MNKESVATWQDKNIPVLSPFALASLVSMILLLIRMHFSGQTTFLFLTWNLFLAWVPFGIGIWYAQKGKNKGIPGFLALSIWLLFLPNAPYILTDLFHLRPRMGVPLWLDLIMILSFAWTGLLLGLASLRMIQKSLLDQAGKRLSWLMSALILLMSSFGVYLGRYYRWNSWDLIYRPGSVLGDLLDILLNPFMHKDCIGFTLGFGAFLMIAYLSYARNRKFIL